MRITKAAALICAMTFCLLCGCHRPQKDTTGEAATTAQSKGASDEVTLSTQAQAEQKIEIAPVELGSAVVNQRAKGHIALPDNATWRVGVLAEGRVEKVYFNLGDFVRKDQVLARMHSHDVHETRAAYDNAVAERSRLQAAAALAEKNYERSQRLYTLKAESVSQVETSKQELVNAQSATREADNDVHREQAHMEEILGIKADAAANESGDADLIPIKAPASGRILQKSVTPGSTLSTSTDAFVIGDLSRLWMLASVDTATLSKLHVGQTATVTLPDVPDATYTGKITNLGQEFDPVTRLIQVRIEIRNPDNHLRPEMLASAEFAAGAGSSAVLVPQESIQQVNGQDVVFVRLAADRFKVQTVQTGENVRGNVRILEGLKPGEQVITHGSFIAKSQLLKSTIGD
ncbi:efflux RND transporter periplasmic adaptor subunit [Tunturiibacter gelidiferens]|uniref:efflux RND transporter periplasmic adaptor subunit n=1 Tax=Tunturiibacter gelidiferens TaxID=3069689 RepID=UPI003D9ADFEA